MRGEGGDEREMILVDLRSCSCEKNRTRTFGDGEEEVRNDVSDEFGPGVGRDSSSREGRVDRSYSSRVSRQVE